MTSISKLWHVAALATLLVACKKDDEVTVPAATFEKPINLPGAPSASAVDVAELADQSLFVLGSVTLNSYPRLLGARLTPTGDTLWTRRYTQGNTGATYVYPFNAVPTTDGQIAVANLTVSNGTGRFAPVVEKLSSTTGAVLWTTTLPTVFGYLVCKIATTADGGFLVVAGGGTSPNTFLVHRLSATGALTSSVPYTGGVATDIRPTTDGNFIIAGVAEPGGKNAPFLLKVTPQGTQLWQQPLPSVQLGLTNSVVNLPDGGYAIASGDGTADGNIHLVRTNSLGQQPQVSTVAPDIKGYINRLEVGPDQNLVLVGGKAEPAAGSGVFRPLLLRLTPTGTELTRQLKTAIDGTVASLTRTRNGELVFCSTEAGRVIIRRTRYDLTQ